MYHQDKWSDIIDHSNVKISDTSPHIQGIDSWSGILMSARGDYGFAKDLYVTPLQKNYDETKNQQIISITNLNDDSPFLDLNVSTANGVIVNGNECQTIELIFDDGYLTCTPWTCLHLSDGGCVLAKDVTSYHSILGYRIIKDISNNRKLNIISRYVRGVREHSFLQKVYNIKSTETNVALPVSDFSGIFMKTDNNI